MNVVNLDEIEWFGHVNHREGGIDFKRIFCGDGPSPNNFEFNLAEVKEAFTTPRHRHNFDQVRFLISGEFGFDKGKVQKAGTIGYFPEGTYYTQQAEGPSQTLLLQCANASCSPYLDFSGLRGVVDELEKAGEFNDGIYTTKNDKGNKVNLDGHQAIWEHATGCKLEFPKPRYKDPIFMDPDDFEFVPIEGEAGAYKKRMLSVTERELEIGFIKIDAGACHSLPESEGEYIYFAMYGSGTVGESIWSKNSALRLSDETELLTANVESEFYYLKLPNRI